MFDMKVLSVAEGIWCIRRPSYLSCSYIIQTENGIVLVDTGMDAQARDTLFALKEIGLNVTDISAILVTHWHLDHCAGLAALQARTGCDIYMHAADYALMAERESWACRLIPNWGPLILLKGHLKNHVHRPQKIVEVKDGMALWTRFVAVATPGHTPGHMSFFDQTSKALFCGDALAVTNQEISRMARFVTPDHPNALASMKRLLDLDFKFLCPGHRYPLVVDPALRESFVKSLANPGWPLLG